MCLGFYDLEFFFSYQWFWFKHLHQYIIEIRMEYVISDFFFFCQRKLISLWLQYTSFLLNDLLPCYFKIDFQPCCLVTVFIWISCQGTLYSSCLNSDDNHLPSNTFIYCLRTHKLHTLPMYLLNISCSNTQIHIICLETSWPLQQWAFKIIS